MGTTPPLNRARSLDRPSVEQEKPWESHSVPRGVCTLSPNPVLVDVFLLHSHPSWTQTSPRIETKPWRAKDSGHLAGLAPAEALAREAGDASRRFLLPLCFCFQPGCDCQDSEHDPGCQPSGTGGRPRCSTAPVETKPPP